MPSRLPPLPPALDHALRRAGRSPRTVSAYAAALRRYLASLQGLAPQDVAPERPRAWLLSRLARGQRVEQDAAALRVLYVELLGWPAERLSVPRPRPPRRVVPVPGRAEVLALAAALPDRRHQLLLLLVYAAGLRVGQVVALRVQDLDPLAGTLSLPGGQAGTHCLPGGQARRIQLPPALARELTERAAGRAPGAPLLPARHGGPFTTRAVQKQVARARRLAGLSRACTTSDLRRAFAAHLLLAGADLRRVQAALGHRRPTTTRRLVPAEAASTPPLPSPL